MPRQQASWEERGATALRWALVAVMLAAVVWVAVRSWRWPIVGDAAVMHYVNLLMDRGLRPYAEITDNNMPGAYLVERWSIALVGRSDVGWRVWDAVLLVIMALAMVGLVGRRRWWVAVFVTGLFAVMNGAAGPMFAVEREQVVTMLLLVGYAGMFAGVRHRAPWLWGMAGSALGMAGTVKPTFLPLGGLVLGWTAWMLWRRGEAVTGLLGAGLLGMFGALAIVLGWMVWRDVVGAWWFVLRQITPAYVGMASAGWRVMLGHAVAPGTAVLAGAGMVLWWVGHGDKDGLAGWELGAVLLGIGWGLLSYWIQGKGFLHHRYTMEVFALLLVGVGVDKALRRRGRAVRTRLGRGVAAGAIGVICVGIVPHYLRALDQKPQRDVLLDGIVRDLEVAAGAPDDMAEAAVRLDGRVMCLDVVYGCLAALDRMGVRETAGFTGDLMLWEPTPSGPREFYRRWFERVMREGAPAVLVVSNEWFGRPNSFGKMDQWPQFLRELQAEYVEVVERRFPAEYGVAVPWEEAPGYRVYVRRGSRQGRR